MHLLSAVFLGFLQGLTEFLPVSFSGHLALFRSLFGYDPQVTPTFDLAVHLANLAVILVVLAPEVGRGILGLKVLMMGQYWKDPASLPEYPYQSGRLALLVIVAFIPTALLGLAAWLFIPGFLSHPDPRIVGFLLILTGSILFATRSAHPGVRGVFEMRQPDGILIGIVRGIAVLPGISRCGSTIAVGLLQGLDRKLAARFAFLLAVPALLGAALLKSTELFNAGFADIPVVLVGMVAAFFSGYVALRILLKVVEKGKLGVFAYYCWAIGLLTVVAALLRS